MRHAHEAALHDNWFRAQVEQALTEADNPTTAWLSNEEVTTHSAARRAEWLKQMSLSLVELLLLLFIVLKNRITKFYVC